MKSEAEVKEFFANELHCELLPLEIYRKRKVKKIRIYLYVALILAIPLVFGIIQQLGVFIGFVIFGILLTLGYAYETLGKMQDELQEKFKSTALPRLLEFMFHQFNYLPNQRIARSTLVESQLISDEITVVEGEDYMRFKLGETGIMFCETIVFRRNKSDGPIFHGVFLAASFNKHFKSVTIILPKSKVSFLSKIIKYKIFDTFKIIKLEDTEFNKEFTVYSTDQVESRYILSTSFMNRLLAYKQKVKRKISVSFVHDKMFCTIPNYINLFEPALFESFYDFSFIQKSYDALKQYTDIVEDLNLNLRIWNKD